MKKILNTFLFILLTILSTSIYAIEKPTKEVSKNQTVYVCTGSYSYAFHSRNNCPGLNNCKAEIQYTDENYALNTLNRRYCCICWLGVSGNCANDNSDGEYSGYNSGGGANYDEAMGYIVIGVIAASAVILSNDMYVYPTYSLNTDQNGFGWSFGFRKTFKRSALEYGASLIDTKYYTYRYGSFTTRSLTFQLNFIHHFFYKKTDDWFTPYAGVSFNGFDQFGYGGVIGAKMELCKRLYFDARYELTTTTHHFKAGLIYNYQKKYFWNK